MHGFHQSDRLCGFTVFHMPAQRLEKMICETTAEGAGSADQGLQQTTPPNVRKL